MKKILSIIFFSLLITACATTEGYQATCEQKYSYFPDVATCLTSSLNGDYRYRFGRKSDYGQLYLAYANKLANEVVTKQITNAQAFQMLNQLYMQLNTICDWHPSTYMIR